MRIGTWNVQGIRTKQKEVLSEIEKLNLDIIILTETKKKGEGEEILGTYTHIWSGVAKYQRAAKGISILIKNKWKKYVYGCQQMNERIITLKIKIFGQPTTIVGVYAMNDNATQVEKDKFFENLNEILDKTNDKEDILLIGDLNSHVGNNDRDIVGNFGEEENKNDNGNRLIDLCREHELIITNTQFQHKNIHRYTWEEPSRDQRSIIDLIIVKKNTKTITQDVRVYRQAECASNHRLVLGKFIYTNRHIRKSNAENEEDLEELSSTRFKTDLLQQYSIRVLYQNRLENVLQGRNDWTPTEMYQHMKYSITKATKEAIGTEGSRSNYTEKFSDELEDMIKEKKQAFHKWLGDRKGEPREQYVALRQRVKHRVVLEKNEYWERMCRDIDNTIGYNKSTEAWKKIKNIRKNTKTRNILQTITPTKWIKHYSALLQENRPNYTEKSRPVNLINEKEITEEDINAALKKAKNNKAPGPGNIKMELLKYGGGKLITFIKTMFNKIENGQDIPTEWNLSYISSIYKKGDKKLTSNYRGISVMPSIARLFTTIIKGKIEQGMNDFSEEQSGFRKNRSCLDNIFCLRQVIEKNRAKNLETHMTFIDLEKAYDSVPREQLWEAMRRMNIREKWINITQRLYDTTKAQIKLGSKLTKTIDITKGLKQGCGLSPILFNIYIEQALERWYRKCGRMGIPIGENILHSLLFADDQVVFSQDKYDMEYMLKKLKEEYELWGLSINLDKTEYLCVGEEVADLSVEVENIKSCQAFKYLGSIMHEDGSCSTDIETKIVRGKQATKALHGLIWNQTLTKENKKRIFHSIVQNITLYGAEVWPMTTRVRDKIRTVELDYMRRCLQLTREHRVRNEEVWRQMNIKCSITRTLENRALQWYGHVNRMAETRWPKRILKWQPVGRRRRGAPKLTWEKYMERAMEERDLRYGDWNNRELWKERTANSK